MTINGANVGGKLQIETGEGADTVTFNGVTGNSKAKIETGGGGDTVGISNNIAFTSLEVNAAGKTAGSDTVTIENTIVNGSDLEVATGEGNDNVTLNGVTGNSKAAIETAGGGDTVNIGIVGASVFASLEVNAAGKAAGNDNVTVQSTTVANKLEVTTGEGADNVTLNSVTAAGAGGATIETAGGGDTINVGLSCQFFSLVVDAAGADSVTIDGGTNVFIKLEITTGDGNDIVAINNATNNGGLNTTKTTIKTGKGNDTFNVATNVTGNVTTRQADVDLGDGDDTIEVGLATNTLVVNGSAAVRTKVKGGKGTDSFLVNVQPIGDEFIDVTDFELPV